MKSDHPPGNIENTALIIIDVQQGLFERATKVYKAEQFLENLKCLIDAARQTDIPFSRMKRGWEKVRFHLYPTRF